MNNFKILPPQIKFLATPLVNVENDREIRIVVVGLNFEVISKNFINLVVLNICNSYFKNDFI